MSRQITFSKNLRLHRIKNSLTQKQLAELIGYTEKSVSKWESSDSLPPVRVIIHLAEILGVSSDELLFDDVHGNYFLGIDGGGTKTVFRLVDENGSIVSETYKGASNPNDIGIENTITLLKDGITEVCRGIPFQHITMFAGLSGGGLTGDNAQILKNFFSKFGFLTFDNGSDIENLVAVADYEKCILVIMGTGFITYAVNGNERKRISGWGQFFDDGGSGYNLGRDLITAVLCEEDGTGRKTLLTPLLTERLGESASDHLAVFYREGKKYIASFADLVFRAAEMNDETAKEILRKNMSFAAHRINTAISFLKENGADKKIPVLFSGGIISSYPCIFTEIQKYLTDDSAELILLKNEQVDGAVKRAKKLFEKTSHS